MLNSCDYNIFLSSVMIIFSKKVLTIVVSGVKLPTLMLGKTNKM